VFDGLRLPVPLPRLASAILPLIDGKRSVGVIAEELVMRGTSSTAFAKAWTETFTSLESINHLLLSAPSADQSNLPA
jgi:hypothetical protein